VDMDTVVVHMDQEEGIEGCCQGRNKGLDTHMEVVKTHNCPLMETTHN